MALVGGEATRGRRFFRPARKGAGVIFGFGVRRPGTINRRGALVNHGGKNKQSAVCGEEKCSGWRLKLNFVYI